MDYLITILGLLATCIALRGETWDKRARSWRRLTWVGRTALGIALVAFVVGIYKTREDRAQRASQRAAAEREIDHITGRISISLIDVARASASVSNPTKNELNNRATTIRSEFGKRAHEYEEARVLYKDVLKAPETEAVSVVSNALAQAPPAGDGQKWAAYIGLLDAELNKQAKIYCKGARKSASDCTQGIDLSVMTTQIFPQAPGTVSH